MHLKIQKRCRVKSDPLYTYGVGILPRRIQHKDSCILPEILHIISLFIFTSIRIFYTLFLHLIVYSGDHFITAHVNIPHYYHGLKVSIYLTRPLFSGGLQPVFVYYQSLCNVKSHCNLTNLILTMYKHSFLALLDKLGMFLATKELLT